MLHSLADGAWYVDLDYLGMPKMIACGIFETEEGLILVDPGPEVTLNTLKRRLHEAGWALVDVHAVLLTHIHLDHAGVTGSIVRECPAAQVFVHHTGLPHLVSPGRLLASARRLYGSMMEQLWGDFLPVPEANLVALYGGEKLAIGERRFEVAYTPGHAIHHVSYLDGLSRTAAVGDVAGMRVTGCEVVLPVTPPPDVDLVAWQESLDKIRAWHPERLFLTHFGPSEHVIRHIDGMAVDLDEWGATVRNSLADERTDEERASAFHEEKVASLRRQLPHALVPIYVQFGNPGVSWRGIARFWRTLEGREHIRGWTQPAADR